MSITSRLLGMAFASADVLLELDREHRVAFAMGAGPAPGVDPGAVWPGQPIETVFDAVSCERLRTAFDALRPGARSEPVEVVAVTPDGHARRGAVRAFLLPDLAPAISCALAWTDPVATAPAALARRPGPMLDARGLLKKLGEVLAQGGTGPELTVAFVEAPGLGNLAAPAAGRIEARLQSASLDGAAACLGSDRFAVVGQPGALADIAEQIRTAGAAEGLELSPVAALGDLPADIDPAVAMRTLRLALDACIKDGVGAGAFFGERLKRAVQDADRFRSLVRQREFSLAYQPIVDLRTGVTHHYEALARLAGADQAPTGPIQMAEELGLIQGFDLAVAEKAIAQMRRPGFGLVKIAINVSGVSLGAEGYVEGLLRMTSTTPELRKRLTVEITETAALADLDLAARRIAALRATGVRVALDDFGVGAASLEYLRRLRVDAVKIDGGFVRDLVADPRARTLAGHVASLCAELKLSTVAEMVETEDQAEAVRALDIDFGQGWLFGRPAPEPVSAVPSSPRARRVGQVEGWG